MHVSMLVNSAMLVNSKTNCPRHADNINRTFDIYIYIYIYRYHCHILIISLIQCQVQRRWVVEMYTHPTLPADGSFYFRRQRPVKKDTVLYIYIYIYICIYIILKDISR